MVVICGPQFGSWEFYFRWKPRRRCCLCHRKYEKFTNLHHHEGTKSYRFDICRALVFPKAQDAHFRKPLYMVSVNFTWQWEAYILPIILSSPARKYRFKLLKFRPIGWVFSIIYMTCLLLLLNIETWSNYHII